MALHACRNTFCMSLPDRRRQVASGSQHESQGMRREDMCRAFAHPLCLEWCSAGECDRRSHPRIVLRKHQSFLSPEPLRYSAGQQLSPFQIARCYSLAALPFGKLLGRDQSGDRYTCRFSFVDSTDIRASRSLACCSKHSAATRLPSCVSSTIRAHRSLEVDFRTTSSHFSSRSIAAVMEPLANRTLS